MALFVELALVRAARPYAADMARKLKVLAIRIARNREIAGLHYPTDSEAGRRLAQSVSATLTGGAAVPNFDAAIAAAGAEWP